MSEVWQHHSPNGAGYRAYRGVFQQCTESELQPPDEEAPAPIPVSCRGSNDGETPQPPSTHRACYAVFA
jgi:hypothetical protein